MPYAGSGTIHCGPGGRARDGGRFVSRNATLARARLSLSARRAAFAVSAGEAGGAVDAEVSGAVEACLTLTPSWTPWEPMPPGGCARSWTGS